MKALIYIFLVSLFFSCKQEVNTELINETEVQNTLQITKEDISRLKFPQFILDNKAEKTINSWQKYQELAVVVEQLNNGNLSYFQNNQEIVFALIKDLNQTIPEAVNTPLITARLLAIETQTKKLEAVLNLSNTSKKEALIAIKDFLTAFSNLNFQINKKFEKEAQKIEKPQ